MNALSQTGVTAGGGPANSATAPHALRAWYREWDESPGLSEYGCLCPLGDAGETAAALAGGSVALRLTPVHGERGGESAPIALMDERMGSAAPRWATHAAAVRDRLPAGDWGAPGRPVIVTSSNFGVDQLLAYTLDRNPERLAVSQPHSSAARLADLLGFRRPPVLISHACVSSSLGLLHACELVRSGVAEEVLVFSFDFISPFVAGGFASLKILNSGLPAPFSERPYGSIGLGDALAWIKVSRRESPFRILASATWNEMHHMTSNEPGATGFDAIGSVLGRRFAERKPWIKGHGTGTLEAGRLEALAFQRHFPGAPLVSWKGSLGHTLGTCGLLETVIALEAVERGVIPGTVGAESPFFTDTVATGSFSHPAAAGFITSSNAFGGAHVAHMIGHD